MFITVIMEFIIRLVGELWDVYHGYHGIYYQTCWGIGGFLAQTSEFVEACSR